MSANQQSLLASQKAVIDNLLAVQGTFFSGFEKLVDLNLKATKAALEDVAQKSQEAAELKDAQELLAFTSALVRPEQAVAYGKDVYEILADIQGDLSKLAEAQLSQGQKQMSDVVEQFARGIFLRDADQFDFGIVGQFAGLGDCESDEGAARKTHLAPLDHRA